MAYARRLGRLAVVMIAVAMPVTAGCGKQFSIREYPTFYDPQIRRVAVLPLRSETFNADAGPEVTAALVSALRDNGTYSILGPVELAEPLRGVLGDPLRAPTAEQYAAVVAALRKLGNVEAFIVGAVTRYDASQWRYYGSYDDGYPHARGYGFYGPAWAWQRGWRYDYEFVTEAKVSVRAAIIRVADAQTLHQGPADVRVGSSTDRPVPSGPVMRQAAARAADELVDQFAVVAKTIRATGNDLRTASGHVEGRWQYTDQFPVGVETIYAVLRLPAQAAGNPFRLTLTPRDQRQQVLAEDAIVWPRSAEPMALTFSPAELGLGPGPYELNLYSGDERVLSKGFKLVMPKPR